MKIDERTNSILEKTRIEKAKRVFLVGGLILPFLYVGFWFIDLIYLPELKWPFLSLRLSILVPIGTAFFLSKRVNSLAGQLNLGLMYAFFAANIITVMIIMSGSSDLYYAGLNLVALCAYGFLPLDRKYFVLTTGVIYLPFYAAAPLFVKSQGDVTDLLITSSFILGTIIIGFLVNKARSLSEVNEANAQIGLRDEVMQREAIIKEKTSEAINLSKLSSQFSPQVVDAISRGEVNIDTKPSRAKISAIFIDIVGSTERVVRLDQDDVSVVISTFMETCANILLKYDLTIDKFYGDGILAFANHPVKRSDYLYRTCMAAIEIKQKVAENQEFYHRKWRKDLELTVGIAVGYANVGFYGSKRFFKQYSAIGVPLPMAARLSSVAEPNQILIDGDVADEIGEQFETEFKGKKKLKGFEEDLTFVYELKSDERSEYSTVGDFDCPKCEDSHLQLETENNIYYMKCRKCGFRKDDNQMEGERSA